ncbi:MAG: hypothetical protein HYR56_08315 [Acidobacteria bacterium]|nr:hypothetical protein [Acidobacteriota bacterium]MBI3428389.1 hypothetical protein [Acidobacteriota bacterium]
MKTKAEIVRAEIHLLRAVIKGGEALDVFTDVEGVAQNQISPLPERHSLSAHRAAEPRKKYA